jgi:hypothetical protein
MALKVLPVLLKDGYKVGHKFQYPKDTLKVYSNLTARQGRKSASNQYATRKSQKAGIVFYGAQAFILRYLVEDFQDNFFSRPVEEVMSKYTRRINNYLGVGAVTFDHISKLHDLGYLPLHIKAVPEGTYVPYGVPCMTFVNTHNDFYWVTNMIETLLSTELWKPCTSATSARQFRQVFDYYSKLTVSDEPNPFVPWQGHDFSFRGMSGADDAMLSGSGHLLFFTGTDTIPAIDFLEYYYGANSDVDLIGGSVSATEHSVMCMGEETTEFKTFKRLITEVYPKGIVSIVADTWDLWNVITNTVPQLKEDILARDGKVVLRPDCYDEQTKILTPRGWVLFKDLTVNDKVAQVLEDNSYEFVTPIEIVNYDYSGPMVHFKDPHGKCDLLVTPEHRMVWDFKGKATIAEANKYKGSANSRMFRSAKAPNHNRTLSCLDRLRIAFQVDGSFTSQDKNNINLGIISDTICFNFSKQRKVKRLVDICEKGNFTYSVHQESKRQNTIYIYLPKDVEITKDFSWVDISDLCSKWCQEFIEEVFWWYPCHDARFKFDTTVKAVADILEYVAISAGYGCLITDTRKEHFNDVHTLHILKNPMLGSQAIEKEVINDFKGKVYCTKVPSGKLLVKRNRCTAVSGNSGSPVKIIVGDLDAPVGSPEYKGAIECLDDVFGHTLTTKGFKTLNPKIGLIYGDSITPERQIAILEGLAQKGYSSDNIVLGIGSYNYQYVTRDTHGFAVKATWGVTESRGEIAIYKNPKTDDGVKKSAKGLLFVGKDENGDLFLEQEVSSQKENQGCLRTIFLNGQLHNFQNINEIRKLAEESL